jgi:hypothetical protein
MKAIPFVIYLFIIAGVCKFLEICKKPTPSACDDACAKVKSDLEAYYRRAVEVAGGIYVGIQEGESDGEKSDGLVLFNSPKTGSTLAVKEENFTAVAVQNRLDRHEQEWGIN